MARLRTRHCFACVLCALLVWIAAARADRALQPILYTVRVTAPATHDADVEGTFPTGRRATIDLMMPVWTPGFYRADDYAGKVAQFTARTPDGRPLTAVKSSANHWQVQTGNALSIVVSYRLRCEQRSVTTNWISEELGVLNGAATFVTLAERTARPHDVWLERVDVRAARGTEILDIHGAAAPLQRRMGPAHVRVVQAHVTGWLAAHRQVVRGEFDLAAPDGLRCQYYQSRNGRARLGCHRHDPPSPVTAPRKPRRLQRQSASHQPERGAPLLIHRPSQPTKRQWKVMGNAGGTVSGRAAGAAVSSTGPLRC